MKANKLKDSHGCSLSIFLLAALHLEVVMWLYQWFVSILLKKEKFSMKVT